MTDAVHTANPLRLHYWPPHPKREAANVEGIQIIPAHDAEKSVSPPAQEPSPYEVGCLLSGGLYWTE